MNLDVVFISGAKVRITLIREKRPIVRSAKFAVDYCHRKMVMCEECSIQRFGLAGGDYFSESISGFNRVRELPDSRSCPFPFEFNNLFAQYAEWALNIPVFLIKRGGQATAAHQHTFAELLQHGFEGQRVTEADWDTHLSSLFPEVRLKRTLETRGADSLPTPHVLALAALWRGLLDDTETRQRLLGVIAAWSSDDLQRLRNALIAEGLRADFRGLPVAEACQSLVESARQGLESLGETRDWLAPLSDLASTAETLADRALKTLGREPQRAALAGYYAQALGAEHA